MTDQELATRLLEIVEPGSDTLRYLANSSDAGMAVVDLINIAATRRVRVPRDLLDEVGALVIDGTPRRLTTCAAIWQPFHDSRAPRSRYTKRPATTSRGGRSNCVATGVRPLLS